jgi:hypothetical protein
MLKWILLALALISSPATAQNVTCATRPVGDSSNACASTAFVQNSATSIVVDATKYFTAAQRADIATGSPTLNLQAPLQQAANYLSSIGGGTLWFPAGTYRWDSNIVLSPNTNVVCSGQQATKFKPLYNFSLFVNNNFITTNLATDTTPATDANQDERNFSISGCTFDWTGVNDQPSPTPSWSYDSTAKGSFFVLAQNVNIHDNYYIASDPPKFNGVSYYGFGSASACVSSSYCYFENNQGVGMHDVFDCWGGGTNCYYKNNIMRLSDNETAHRGNGYCVGMNGRGTAADFHATLENIEISGNYCYSQGWHSCIQFDPLSAGSHVNKVKITDNICVAKSGTTNNTGIYARGQVNDVLIDGNTIDGMNSLPVQVADSFSGGGPFTCTDCISTTNGSDIVTVAITTLTNTNVTVGNYLLFSGGTGAVGGITFASKYFLVTEVTSGVNVKVQADASASSSATGGGAVSTNVWWGAPDGVRIFNNNFNGSSYANNALVYGVGTNLHISGTSATGGTYGAVTFASSFFRGATNTPLPVVYGTSGAAGTGIAGTSGNNIDNYASTRNPRTSFPAIVLACGADPTTTALEDGLLWCNTSSSSVKARLGGATMTIPALDSTGKFTTAIGFGNGINFGSQTAASATDLSKHIALFSTTYGFDVTSNRLNYVAPGTANHAFMLGGVDIAYLNASGLRIPAGSLALNYAVKTADYVVTAADSTLTFDCSATCTVTLPAPSAHIGHLLTIRTVANQAVVSASSNVVPLAGGAAGTAITAATAGKWAVLQSDGTNYQTIQGNP